MASAPYTFTLSAAQSSATSMVVAMRAKTGSSIPGNASHWQGGVMPQATLNFAAGVTTATVTVNTAPNSTVDGNAEYEWYKVSSTPSDLTLDTSALPTVTITDDDDTSGGGSNIIYPVGSDPASTADTTLRNAGGPHRISGKLVPGFTFSFGMDAAGDNGYKIAYLDGTGRFIVKDRQNGSDSDVAGYNYQEMPGISDTPTDYVITFDADGRTTFVYNGNTLINAVRLNGKTKTGTYARAQHASAQPTTITRIS